MIRSGNIPARARLGHAPFNPVGIDWTNPLARDLVFCAALSGGQYLDLVSGVFGVPNEAHGVKAIPSHNVMAANLIRTDTSNGDHVQWAAGRHMIPANITKETPGAGVFATVALWNTELLGTHDAGLDAADFQIGSNTALTDAVYIFHNGGTNARRWSTDFGNRRTIDSTIIPATAGVPLLTAMSFELENTTPVRRIYTDGVIDVDTTTTTGGGTPTAFVSQVTIGASAPGNDYQNLQPWLLMAWGRELTAEEHWKLYESSTRYSFIRQAGDRFFMIPAGAGSTFESSVEFGGTFGASNAADIVADEAMSLAVQGGLSAAAAHDALGAITLALQGAVTASGGLLIDETATMALQGGLSSESTISIDDAISLGLQPSMAAGAIGTFLHAVSLGSSLGQEVSPAGSVYERAATLALQPGAAMAGGTDFAGDITLAFQGGISDSASSAFFDEATMALQAGVSASVNVDYQASMSLALEAAQPPAGALDALAAIALAIQGDMSTSGSVGLQEGTITLAATLGASFNGTINVTVPSERINIVPATVRSLTVPPSVRSISS